MSANVNGGTTNTGRRIESASLERYPGSQLIDPAGPYCRNILDNVVNNLGPSGFSTLGVEPFTGTSVKIIPSGNRGMTLTKEITQAALSAVSPQYLRGRMKVWDVGDSGSMSDGGGDNFRLDVQCFVESDYTTTTPPTAQIYYSAGVEYNPVFFGCTPALYDWGALAPALS